MQKNILILWLGAFGFAVAKHLGENNPEQIFHASEVNTEIFKNIKENRMHPYFFEGIELPKNIELLENTQDFLPKADVIISVIPCQFVGQAFQAMKSSLKNGVIILNLSKGIDNQSLQTVSEKLNSLLNPLSPKEKGAAKSYTYAYLAGGMIAQEVVDRKMLGADIVTEKQEAWQFLKELFQSENLAINLKIWNPKNTELYAALKNIIALILGYYEWGWAGASTLGYYFSKLLGEIQWVIKLLNFQEETLSWILSLDKGKELQPSSLFKRGNSKERYELKSIEIDFTDYALSWDLIATCFGASRNRLLGNMLGEWKDITLALTELRTQKKIAEGYETLKGVYKITQWKEGFEEINNFAQQYVS